MLRYSFSSCDQPSQRLRAGVTSSGAAGVRVARLRWGRALAWGAALSSMLTLGCSSEKEKGGTTITRPVNPPCSNELAGDCGEACENDSDCGGGLFCKDAQCTAECTPGGGQCDGTCTDEGRCQGTVKTEDIDVVEPDDGINVGIPSGTSPVPGGGAACATGSSKATLANVNMFLMFDQSSSMTERNRWDNATAALVRFLQAPESGGLKIALRFFASDEPAAGCNVDQCNVDACAQPLIDLGELTSAAGDAHESTLVNAIQSRSPNGRGPGTPISAALQGAVNWAIEFNSTAPETERAVVVFVTDGEPSGCEQNTNRIAAIAGAGAEEGVLTFSVGLEGSSESLMNAIAREGGSGDAIFVGDGNAEEDLLTALNAIRGRALACDFPLPTGDNVDPSKVNVTFTRESGEEEQWTKVSNEAACAGNQGWHYNSENAPTSVVLCPASCEVASASPGAKIDVVFGCETNKPVTR